MATKYRPLPIEIDKRGLCVMSTHSPYGWTRTEPYTSDGAAALKPLDGAQLTESESHPGWNSHKGSFKGDFGGNFFTRKYSISGIARNRFSGVQVDGDGWSYSFDYDGLCLPCAPSLMEYPPVASSNDDTLDEAGATAIARCSPTNPIADLTTAVGEFVHDGLPKLSGSLLGQLGQMSAKDRRKAIGDEYLNHQFGVVPLANDIADTANGIISHDEIISQYERDSGKMVRRRYAFPVYREQYHTYIKDGATPWVTPSVGVMYDNSWSSKARVLRTYELERRRWFSGAFTYYIPPRDGSLKTDMARDVILAKKTLGIRLTPDAVWNLAPWSWAIDWFTNAGDVLKNIDAFIIDGQVLLYGYMMEHTIAKYTYSLIGPHNMRSGVVPSPVTLTTEVKLRRKATPYGFGFTWESFSPFQLSILTALGLSKGR